MQSIRKTLAWMDLVLANLSEGVLVVDRGWRVVFANDSLSRVVGTERIFLLGQAAWRAVPLTRDGVPLSQMIDPKRPIEEIDSLDGVYALVVGRTSRLVYLSSKYVQNLDQAVCVVGDVTVEMRAEQRLKDMSDQLGVLQAKIDQQNSKRTGLTRYWPLLVFGVGLGLGALFKRKP